MATTKKMTKLDTVVAAKEEAKATGANVKKKVYDDSDLIPCRSIVNGQLFIKGTKSGMPYMWADYNDVANIEYQDLIYMIRSTDKSVFEPRIIIDDEDLVAQYPKLTELYESLYSMSDLARIKHTFSQGANPTQTGKKFPGNHEYISFIKEEDYPVFASAGAIIPMNVSSNNNMSNHEKL